MLKKTYTESDWKPTSNYGNPLVIIVQKVSIFLRVFDHTVKTVLVWRERLNSVGQQFQHNQQTKQSPLIVAHWTQKNTMAYDVGNPGPGLGQRHTYGGVKLLHVS